MPKLSLAHDRQEGTSTTELVLLMPVVLLVVMLLLQLGLWLHARQVATAAAQEGLGAAQVLTGTGDAGRQRAELFLTEAGGLHDSRVSAVRELDRAEVEVTGVAPAVIPGWSVPVSAVAQGPVERFVSEAER